MKIFSSNLLISISIICLICLDQLNLVSGSLACGGFIKSIVNINYARVSIKLLTASGNLKYTSEGAPNNGYYFIPVYDNGDYVLKVDAPFGWKFEPNQVQLKIDGTSDPCTQGVDINFSFKGFTITGKIISDSLDSGPKGVTIKLKDKSGKLIKSVITKSEGSYAFEEVLPGDYEIIVDDEKLSFVGSNSIIVTVSDDNVILDPKDSKQVITISGYSVGGRVTSDGERIGGVNFALYSLSGKKRVPTGCNTESIVSRKVDITASAIYLCHTLSTVEGRFEFKNLPPGNYRLIAFYRGNNIEFGVEPSHIDFKVEHENVELKNGFTVEGFSVSGKILTCQGGKGIEGAQVLVKDDKGTEKVISSLKDGIFHLENMKTGTYSLQVKASHMIFGITTVRISPSSPLIPDIIASAFETCGQLKFKSNPIPLEIEITKSSGKDFVSHSIITSKSDGTFCSFLEPGKYRFKPIIPVDQENELVFTPKYLELLIEEKSKLDLTFHQFAASVSGSLILKEPKVIVNDISIDLILDDKTIDSVQPDQQSKEFKFKSIAPGKYRLRLRKGDNIWCWKEDEMTINILDEDLTGIKFTQIGYYLTLVTSHPVKVTITHTTSKKSINAEIKNVQQPFRQCLLESGRYEVNTVSCHSFKNDKGLKEPFIFDTRTKETSSSLIIRAYKHQLTGSVAVTVPVESSEEFVLSLTRKSNINDQKGSTNGLDYLPSSSKSDNQGNLIKMFKFSLFAEPNELLTIEPSSTSLLFKPPKFEKSMGSDCLLDAVSFKGRSGLFIKGSISPPLMDATIKLYSRSDDQLMYETVTDAEGKYTAGPFDCCDAGITIDRMIYAKAEKVGYLLKESSKFGQFVSEKLSSLIVKVTNADGSPLPEVLISISGGSNNFRKNLITPDTGELSFIGLNPGEYFMRSVLKEFKFDPASRIVDIKQGESVTLNVKGERVAYSCYGSLTSMSEEPEANILVEAVGIGGVNEQGFDCKQLQEEVTSESNGNFRIRDLKPGCNYRVSVKKSNEQNLIARSLPENVIISIGKVDVTGIKLILFTRSNTMELTGDIITNPEFWPSLRVKLFSESIGDQLLASIPVTSGFFSIPTQIPVDNRWYILKLESTLPTYLYSYETASLTFQANTTYSHFQFQFDPKQSSNSDSFNGEQDNISTGSLFTLPLFLLLGLIIYKFDKVKPIFDYVIEKVWSTIHPDGRSSPNSDGSLRRKIKSRRT